MSKLIEMPNIGKVAENLLIKTGIDTPEKLIAIGSKEAFLKIRNIDPSACLHMLYGLEGAVLGIRDTKLSPEKKLELKEFFYSL
ncbi:MAG: TfoX/Sxy family protein [Candidatus Wallbacteria bacterium]